MGNSPRFIVWFLLCFLSQTACARTTKENTVTDSVGDIYQNGSHTVKTVKVANVGSICCPLWVAIPEDAGRYPVVQFQHGTQLQNTDYTALISQIASWGFIVVAPQMYSIASLDATTEITNARAILNWMKTGLIQSLPPAYANHQPDFSKVTLAGHSRGGLVAFGLALNYGNPTTQQYAALVGLDPVDASWPMSPRILKHQENSLAVGVPTLIVGTGLGSSFPACAPTYRGHVNFYTDLTPASFHFVARDYGHMDFTDDCSLWELSVRCKSPCWPGPSRQPLRRFAAGIVVAFLQDVLFHNNVSLSGAMTGSVTPPVVLDPPQSKGKIPRSVFSPARQLAGL